jgi:hypothetical protein
MLINSNRNDIDMALLKGNLVSGKISISEADTWPDKEVSLKILASSADYFISQSLTIKEGTKEVNYQFTLPLGTYYFKYEITNQDITYEKVGYFSTSGTTYSYNLRSNVFIDTNTDGINMTIRELHLLTGRISIPLTEPVLDKDISVQNLCIVKQDTRIWSNTIYIKAGTREAIYQFRTERKIRNPQSYINNTSEVSFVRELYST